MVRSRKRNAFGKIALLVLIGKRQDAFFQDEAMMHVKDNIISLYHH
jgi:hypothetical protein